MILIYPGTESAGVNWRGRETRKNFQLVTDRHYTPTELRFAPGLPRVGDVHPNDSGLWVDDVQIRPHETNPLIADAEVTYRMEVADTALGGDTDGAIQYPWDKPPRITWGFIEVEEDVDTDVNDDPIVNAVGEPFDPRRKRTFCDQTAKMTLNRLNYDPDYAAEIANVVNSDTYQLITPMATLTAEPQTLLLKPLEAEWIAEDRWAYWQITATFVHRLDGWWDRVLNRGRREFMGYAARRPIYRQLVDSQGQPVGEPELLDAAGKLLDEGSEPVWLRFQVFKEVPFNNLRL